MLLSYERYDHSKHRHDRLGEYHDTVTAARYEQIEIKATPPPPCCNFNDLTVHSPPICRFFTYLRTLIRVLRAQQLTKLLLNAPLLSLSRLHVTALMSQAHVVDGMVDYVQWVSSGWHRSRCPLARPTLSARDAARKVNTEYET